MKWLDRYLLKSQATLEFVGDEYKKMQDGLGVKQERRLKIYSTLVGVGLLFGIIYCLIANLYLYSLIMFCTFHLQVFFNYKFKQARGLPQWSSTRTSKQKDIKNG